MPMRTPFRYFAAGPGVSDEHLKISTLTKYLQLETWTPLMASLLVCGLEPIPDCPGIPDATMCLDFSFYTGQEDAFPEARRVLELWNSREDVPLKVRPAVFVAWCKTKGINTDWLREIPEDAPEGCEPQATASSLASVVGMEPSFETVSAMPELGWSVKTSIKRAPGYRWALMRVLKAAHVAGQPCPTARDVLTAWTLNPPPDVQVTPDSVKYNTGTGTLKEADLKAIGQAIKGLLS